MLQFYAITNKTVMNLTEHKISLWTDPTANTVNRETLEEIPLKSVKILDHYMFMIVLDIFKKHKYGENNKYQKGK